MKGQTTYGEKVADAGVRFAFYGRVSTEDNQDPTLSLPRQLANSGRAVAEAGGRIVAHFYDVESGAMRLDARGSGKGLAAFNIPIPRGRRPHRPNRGGIDPVRSTRSYASRSTGLSRNPSVTFRVEEQLAEEGVRLWAIDEPFEESFGSIVLRHVNVGLARGYLHELKVKSRQGIETAAKQGRHAGAKRCGYRFAEFEHPNPHKPAQGLKVKVLEPDPVTSPVVKMIFHDYVVNGLTITDIERKLNSGLERYPPPQSPDPKRRTGMWGRSSVWEILHSPKYTGYQV